MSVSGPRPAVAVIAVHGVADQAPEASARAISNLLLQYAGAQRYTAAREIKLNIPTRPPLLSSDQAAGPTPSRATFFDDARARSTVALQQPSGLSASAAPDHQLMRSQLEGYRASGEPYSTLRLETQRLDAQGIPGVDVHVYEMYWADLSRLGTGVFRFFGELYQLLFHSASLGRQTLDYAALEHGDNRGWNALRSAYRSAARILTIVVPCVALVILAIGSSPLALMAPVGWRAPVAIALLGVVLALAVAHRQYRRGAPGNFAWWTLTRALVIVAVAALLREGLARREGPLGELLILEWAVVVCLGLLLVLRAYDRYRPGALKVGMGLYLFGAVLSLIFWLSPHSRSLAPGSIGGVVPRATRVVLWTIEVLWSFGIVAWVVLFVVGIVAWLLGWLVVHLLRKRVPTAPDATEAMAAADRAVRAVRTSRLTLALPAAAFIIVTTILWYVVVAVTEKMVEGSSLAPILALEHCRVLVSGCSTVRVLLSQLLWDITTLGVPLAALLLALGLALLSWWVVPIAATEIRLPRDATRQEVSERMGLWLSQGLAYALASVSALVLLVVFVGAAAWVASRWLGQSGEAQTTGIIGTARGLVLAGGQVAQGAIKFLGGFLVAGSVGILALRRGRLDAVSRAGRPVLDVILDVDGYLREHPRDRTPRARIAERYLSLLRYLCAWRHPDAPDLSYQAIVIVAHSQGTVISADLLGFLRRERDPALDPIVRPGSTPTIPTYLFTMGSPLRQLYEQFFPHLYSWVTRRPAVWRQMDLNPETALAMPGPDPSALRLSRWVNAYRSGDYIGRYLWLQDADARRFHPGVRAAEDRHCDLCIGAGAHTHYWDSAEIGRELDDLIAVAVRRGASTGGPATPGGDAELPTSKDPA